jgi:hypothetical protein
MRFMGSGNPICQVRVNNLEAELSRNTKKGSILTENTPALDVKIGCSLTGHVWQPYDSQVSGSDTGGVAVSRC